MNAVIDITDVIIETERLMLRPWRIDDLGDFFEYASVDGVGQMAGWEPHTSIAVSETVLKLFIEEKKTFALELKENNKVIGSLGIEKLSRIINDDYSDIPGREIGYVLNKKYWGRGLMPEAVKAVIEYCFSETECEYLICSCAETNNQSKRVIDKCGFSFIDKTVRKLSNGTERTAMYHVIEK